MQRGQIWCAVSKYKPTGINVLKTTGGFSKAELLIVLAVVAIVVTISIPSLQAFQMSLDYRQTAREMASALRQARSLAVAMNREHKVEFDIPGRQYRVKRGNRANQSTDWAAGEWVTVPSGVALMRNKYCDNGSDTSIEFNPNGTANSQYVCVMGSSNAKKYRVGVPQSVTGRVKIDDYPWE